MFDTEALLTLVESLAPAGVQVVWSGSPRAFHAINPDRRARPFSERSFGAGAKSAGFIEISIASYRRRGEDEYTSTFVEGSPGTYKVYYLGLREFTFTLRVEGDRIDTRQISESIADKLQWRSVREALRALGLSVANVLANTEVDAVWDKREISANVLDIDMIERVCIQDTTVDPQGWIQKIGEPNAGGPDGLAYNLTNEPGNNIIDAIIIDGSPTGG